MHFHLYFLVLNKLCPPVKKKKKKDFLENQSPQSYLKNTNTHKAKDSSISFPGFCVYHCIEIAREECNQICVAFAVLIENSSLFWF